MVTETRERLALTPNTQTAHTDQTAHLDGAWWPQSRRLTEQLGVLFSLWPPAEGRISRVWYSPPDWDDHPHSVPVAGRVVKTGSFPKDDTHTLVLGMAGGSERTLTVIAPDTALATAASMLNDIAGQKTRPRTSSSDQRGNDLMTWDNEGGHS